MECSFKEVTSLSNLLYGIDDLKNRKKYKSRLSSILSLYGALLLNISPYLIINIPKQKSGIGSGQGPWSGLLSPI